MTEPDSQPALAETTRRDLLKLGMVALPLGAAAPRALSQPTATSSLQPSPPTTPLLEPMPVMPELPARAVSFGSFSPFTLPPLATPAITRTFVFGRGSGAWLVNGEATDHLGVYPMNCHNTLHEDHGMMLLLRVDDVGDNNAQP